jgi:hypothetical protein
MTLVFRIFSSLLLCLLVDGAAQASSAPIVDGVWQSRMIVGGAPSLMTIAITGGGKLATRELVGSASGVSRWSGQIRPGGDASGFVIDWVMGPIATPARNGRAAVAAPATDKCSTTEVRAAVLLCGGARLDRLH